MYEERKEKFSIRDLILQILFILLFIFLLMWLFPTRSDIKTIAGKCDGNNTTSSECVNKGGNDNSILYDRIFNENVLAMKDAAKSYFTKERLPQNIGDKVTMTLEDMLSKKIVLPFKDKNGKACSDKASYVEVTKTKDNEYILKVNLKCGDEENYLLVYMGCYDYCTTATCEKNRQDVTNPVIHKVTPTPKPVVTKKPTSVPTSKPTVTPNPTKTPDPTYACKIVDGKYWGKDKKVVDKATYVKECTTPTPTPTPTYACKIVDGKYWGKNKKVVDKATYVKECTTPTPTPTPVKVCEYAKVENGSFSAWSAWSAWSTEAQSASLLKQVKTRTVTETVTKKVLVGYNVTKYNDTSKPIYKTVRVQTGTKTTQVCSQYKTVTTTSEGGYSAWQDQGLVKLYNIPSNSDTVKYVFVSRGVDSCENCSYKEYRIYKKYTRSYTAGKTTTNKVCAKYETVSTPVYTDKKVLAGYEQAEKKEPIYKNVKQVNEIKQYSFRTRTVIKGKKITKWDVCSNSSLEKDGYKKTGNTKNK